jgi:hypothetical protein
VIAGSWHDANGNAGAGGSTSFTVDTVTPTVAVAINSSNVTLAHNTATVTFAFSEAPVSFVLGDTSATGGSLTNLQKVDATHYTATFTGAANTDISNASVSVIGGSWQEGNGNPGAGGAAGNFTVDTMDHWINSSGGNWATASNWKNGVPTAAIGADIDASGLYLVGISSADVAYGLTVNSPLAIVSDNTGGVLTLAGVGGQLAPNGALSLNNGAFVLAGGSLHAGAISIGSGGIFLVFQGQYTGQNAISNPISNNGWLVTANSSIVNITGNISGTGSTTLEGASRVIFAGNISEAGPITIENSATATINGIVSGQTFNVEDGAALNITSAITGTAGSFTLMNSANLEFGAAESENVVFAGGATGTVKFDKSALVTGELSGLTPNNKVDLADLSWVSGKMKATFAGNSSGGVLTVTNGANNVKLNLLGNYTHASWNLSKDGVGGTLVVDPPASGTKPIGGAWGQIDLSDPGFSAYPTLVDSADSANTGGAGPVSDSSHAASLALLSQYAAASLVTACDGHGGTPITDPLANQPPPLTQSHA